MFSQLLQTIKKSHSPLDPSTLAQSVYTDEDNRIEEYALQRILTASKIWNGEYWEANKFKNLTTLTHWLEHFSTLDTDDKVRYSLQCEYGRVLDVLKNSHFVLSECNPQDLKLSSSTHKPSEHANFNPHYPVALVYGTAGTHVLDGYHRTASAKKAGLTKVLVLQAL